MIRPRALTADAPIRSAEIALAGMRLHLLSDGALWVPDEAVLVVSDLHFEKGSSFARRGLHLPPYDTRTTLRRIAVLVRELAPRRVVSLGDAFHDAGAEARMDAEDAARLDALTKAARWTWVLGNHDPRPPKRLAGDAAAVFDLGPLSFRHEPSSIPVEGEVFGHLHPCARLRIEGRSVRRRCFATDRLRLAMPAFGAYTGGLNVLDPAFASVFDRFTAFVPGAFGVHAFPDRALQPDDPRAARAAG